MPEESTVIELWASILAPLVLFATWRLLRRFRAVRNFVSRFLWSATLLEALLLVLAAYCFGLIGDYALRALGVDWAAEHGSQIPLLFIYLAVATGISRFTEIWLLTLHGDRGRIAMSRLSRTVLYGVGISIGLLAFLVNNGYTLLSISTGAVAAGFAFAAQRTMGDLIAGIALSIEGAFRVGDWLRLDDGYAGEIVNIDWRATHLRGWDSANRIIPNTQLTRQSFVRLPRKAGPYGQTYTLLLSGRTSPSLVLSLLKDAVDKTASVIDQPSPAIRLADATSDPYAYSLWVHFDGYLSMFAGRDELFRNVHDAFHGAGLSVSPDVMEVHGVPQIEGRSLEAGS